MSISVFHFSKGEKWYTRRRLITPTFHFEILNDFMQVMNEQSEILVDILNDLHRKGEPIDIFKRMSLCTLDIICGKDLQFDQRFRHGSCLLV